MGFLRELRTSLENPRTPLSYPAEWLFDIFNGGRTDAGIRVSELTALQVATIYTAVDLISGGLASLDLNVYEQLQPRGKRIASEQDLHWILHDEPNPEMTGYTFIKTVQCHCLLWTNGYAEIERDNAERPLYLWPRNPNATRPRRLLSPMIVQGEVVPAGELVFFTTDGVKEGAVTGPERPILKEDMIHVPGLSLDGRIGKPVIELARQVIGLALAAEKFGAKFFANGIRPSGVFELPNEMSPTAVENFKRSIQESNGGENMLRPIITETGITFKPYEVKPNEAQFMELRRHQREEMGALFHVPLRMLGDSGKSTKGSAEQEAIEFVQYTLRPWIKAWQPELKRKLFPKKGRTAGKFFPGFYYQDLLTPDAESRGKLISLLKQWGIGNTDDIRDQFMDWNPVGGKAGETYWMPVNMVNANHPLELAPPDPEVKNELPPIPVDAKLKQPQPSQDPGTERAFYGLFTHAFRHLLSREGRSVADIKTTFGPILTSIATSFCSDNPFGEDILTGGIIPASIAATINEYIPKMGKRSNKWTGDENCCRDELSRAVRAMKVSVYREIATRVAKGELQCRPIN